MKFVSGQIPPGLGFDILHAESEVRPMIVFIHGGGWMSGDRTMFAEEAHWFAHRGYHTALISYRLAPESTFPDQVVDCRNFVRWVRENPTTSLADPERIIAFGNSAGGHLALMLVLCRDPLGETEQAFEPVSAAISLAGIADLTDPTETHYEIAEQFLTPFMGGGYEDRHHLYAQASPIAHVSSQAPPTLLFHGDQDDIVPPRQSERLYEKLLSVGAKSRYRPLPGEGHAYTLGALRTIRQETIDFLAESNLR